MYVKIKVSHLIIGVVLLGSLLWGGMALAGDPDSSSDPDSTNSYSLEDLYHRLNAGTAGTQSAFTEPGAGPGTGTMSTINEIMAVAPALDNTNGATTPQVISGTTFWGLNVASGQWGLQTGTLTIAADPPCFDNANRYVDCGNGTVNDTVTNLIWLKNANCFGLLDYAAANNAAAGLEDGECGLTDGSSPGDWRLPTEAEWRATIEQAVALLCTEPSLTNTSGAACYSTGPQSFTGVQSSAYWSSTTYTSPASYAWYVSLYSGSVDVGVGKTGGIYVWPVRGGQ